MLKENSEVVKKYFLENQLKEMAMGFELLDLDEVVNLRHVEQSLPTEEFSTDF